MNTPEYLIVSVRSPDGFFANCDIKVPAGMAVTVTALCGEDAGLRIHGPDGDCPRDQQRFVVTSDGLVPADELEPW